MTPYWVSTPSFTVLVVVNRGGIVAYCARYLYKMAWGKPWANLCQTLRSRYGADLRIERLE